MTVIRAPTASVYTASTMSAGDRQLIAEQHENLLIKIVSNESLIMKDNEIKFQMDKKQSKVLLFDIYLLKIIVVHENILLYFQLTLQQIQDGGHRISTTARGQHFVHRVYMEINCPCTIQSKPYTFLCNITNMVFNSAYFLLHLSVYLCGISLRFCCHSINVSSNILVSFFGMNNNQETGVSGTFQVRL